MNVNGLETLARAYLDAVENHTGDTSTLMPILIAKMQEAGRKLDPTNSFPPEVSIVIDGWCITSYIVPCGRLLKVTRPLIF
ncbi:MAG: hypothetical protein WC824_15340 [Bacteroidota bacterium]